MNTKFYQLLFTFCFFALNFSVKAQDTINFVGDKNTAHFPIQIIATQGKQYTVDWGDGTIQTYTGTGNLQDAEHSYYLFGPPYFYQITIAGSENDCCFTEIAVYYPYEFDASKAKSLKKIVLKGSTNSLKQINLSNCTALEYLQACSQKLYSIDLSDCTSLHTLIVYDSSLSSLDVSQTAALKYINCFNNHLPLSQCYPTFLKVLDPDGAMYHTQHLGTQSVWTGDTIDFSSEKEFGGIATLFRVYIGSGFDGSQLAPDSTYSVKDGMIVFHTKGFYTVRMNNSVMNAARYPPSVYASFNVAQSVQEIINVPKTAFAGTPLTLTGKVVPNDATYKTIIWSVSDAGTTGATISGSKLNTTDIGTVVITATIKNGKRTGIDFTQNFSIEVIKMGINESTQELSTIIVFPNPTTRELWVESGKLRIDKVEIFDVIGKNQATFSPHSPPLISINIAHLQTGIYFVKIYTEAGEVIKKVVKQ